MNSTVVSVNLFDRCSNRGIVGDVDLIGRRATNFLSGGFCKILVKVEDGDLAAIGDDHFSGGSTQARSSAGNDR